MTGRELYDAYRVEFVLNLIDLPLFDELDSLECQAWNRLAVRLGWRY